MEGKHLIDRSAKLLIDNNFCIPDAVKADQELENEGYSFFDRKFIIDMLPIIKEHLESEGLI